MDGKPRIIDAAAEHAGRIYTVESDLPEQGGYREVKGLIADYLAKRQVGGNSWLRLLPRAADLLVAETEQDLVLRRELPGLRVELLELFDGE